LLSTESQLKSSEIKLVKAHREWRYKAHYIKVSGKHLAPATMIFLKALNSLKICMNT